MKLPDKSKFPISEINVTPLVDVMLVLLIIFMITAPHLEQGVPVNLPEVTTTALPVKSRELVITITAQKKIYINRYQVSLKDLKRKIKEILSQRKTKELYLRADKSVPYGFVVKVMAELKEAGAQSIGLVTQPERIEK